jgi:hypothetical protein
MAIKKAKRSLNSKEGEEVKEVAQVKMDQSLLEESS